MSSHILLLFFGRIFFRCFGMSFFCLYSLMLCWYVFSLPSFAGTAMSTILHVLFFLLIIIKSGLRAEIRWSECRSKSHRSLRESFSRTGAGLCIGHLFVWSNLNFLHISQGITLPTQSCLVLYSFCANLRHSLIVWLMVSSAYICYFVASYLFSLWYDWFLRRCLVLLLGEILFLS